jgi:hypothetical protein
MFRFQDLLVACFLIFSHPEDFPVLAPLPKKKKRPGHSRKGQLGEPNCRRGENSPLKPQSLRHDGPDQLPIVEKNKHGNGRKVEF